MIPKRVCIRVFSHFKKIPLKIKKFKLKEDNMKKKFVFSIFAIIISIALMNTSSFAQTPLLVEDFPYAPGSLLTGNNWTAHSGAGTNSIATVTPGLTLTGYPSSGVGNAASLTVSGEDVHRVFPVQTSGSVYAAFMVNTSEAAINPVGGYFFHLSPDPIGSAFRGRVYIKKNEANNIAFGISKAGTTEATVAFTPFTYALNTTYLVIVKYTIVDGDANDTVSLFVSTTTPATEPAATVSAIDTTATDISLATVALRQGTASTSPTVVVDGIRIGTSWASVTQTSSTPTQSAVIDFDGDGKTDVSIFRPSGGEWWYLRSSDGSNRAFQFGASNDKLVPADYTGDGKTDFAVFRPSTGEWFILRSEDNSFFSFPLGVSTDVPAPADFDGDGKADAAVYRPSTGTWFILRSSDGQTTITNFGAANDLPVAADYDGDGKADIAIYRPSTGEWWLNRSTAGLVVLPFGTSTDKTVQADYTGDGKADVAFWRPSTGQWFVLRSEDFSFFSVPFGATGDSPAPGDYDGDGKSDFAVYRSSENTWYINRSTSGVQIIRFGTAGDQPVPSAFVR